MPIWKVGNSSPSKPHLPFLWSKLWKQKSVQKICNISEVFKGHMADILLKWPLLLLFSVLNNDLGWQFIKRTTKSKLKELKSQCYWVQQLKRSALLPSTCYHWLIQFYACAMLLFGSFQYTCSLFPDFFCFFECQIVLIELFYFLQISL